jgi:CheY-like chemotaxis protein
VRQSHLFDRIVAELGSIEGEQKPPAASDGAPLAGKRRVLVAEDNASLRELIGNQLERLGIEARIVENCAQAVQAAGEERFDLVLMDCQMPELDGYEATRAIRRHEARTGDHVPIVAMTANAFTEDRDACLAAGMDDYLAKPLRIEALRRAIERWQIGAHGLVDREKDMIRSDDGEET